MSNLIFQKGDILRNMSTLEIDMVLNSNSMYYRYDTAEGEPSQNHHYILLKFLRKKSSAFFTYGPIQKGVSYVRYKLINDEEN